MTPMSNPVWANPIEEAAFREKWCDRCFYPPEAEKRVTGRGLGCPLLRRAETGRLPIQWKRRRNATMGDTYRCSEYLKKPPVNRRSVSGEEPDPMIDTEPAERFLVPVDGWPDYRSEQRKKETDHS